MVTYLKYHKSEIVELMSKTFEVHAVDNWFYATSKNNFANSANSFKELEALISKRLKFVA